MLDGAALLGRSRKPVRFSVQILGCKIEQHCAGFDVQNFAFIWFIANKRTRALCFQHQQASVPEAFRTFAGWKINVKGSRVFRRFSRKRVLQEAQTIQPRAHLCSRVTRHPPKLEHWSQHESEPGIPVCNQHRTANVGLSMHDLRKWAGYPDSPETSGWHWIEDVDGLRPLLWRGSDWPERMDRGEWQDGYAVLSARDLSRGCYHGPVALTPRLAALCRSRMLLPAR